MSHIPGRDNDAADALSRPAQFPTWLSAMEKFPEPALLRAYRIPVKLLPHLLSVVSGTLTKVPLEPAALVLLDLGLNTCRLGDIEGTH